MTALRAGAFNHISGLFGEGYGGDFIYWDKQQFADVMSESVSIINSVIKDLGGVALRTAEEDDDTDPDMIRLTGCVSLAHEENEQYWIMSSKDSPGLGIAVPANSLVERFVDIS